MTHELATPSTAEGFLLPASSSHPAPTGRAVIVANGELGDPQALLAAIHPGDLLVAADGGTAHLLSLGLRPHAVIGDFDSLDPETLAGLDRDGADLQRHPARKDKTDLELAVRYVLSKGGSDILIFGALGGRWDQTLANLLLPALPDLFPARIRLVNGAQQIYLIRGVGRIEGQPGDTVSLIPLSGDARGITTQGLEYPLDDETIPLGSTRGISNVLLEHRAQVDVREGLLMCVVIGPSTIESLKR